MLEKQQSKLQIQTNSKFNSFVDAAIWPMRENFRLNDALNEVVSIAKPKADAKGLVIKETWLSPRPDFIFSNAQCLRQILLNLIENAVKFTERGRVQINYKVIRNHEQNFLEIQVADTGIGITKAQREKIFSAQALPENKLAMSKRLSILLGGDLILDQSIEGVGTTFILKIAIGDLDENQNENSRSEILPDLDLSDKKVLIVDDSADNQTLMGLFIRSANATCDFAQNGLEAIKKVKEQKYDVILMDIFMPVMDGYGALKGIQKLGFKGPIIAVTAHAIKEEKERSLKAGFDEYLCKPLDRNRLILTIRRLLET